ncbi:hypothetical protein NFJ02_35g88030 [Pycnococcus provasolii]
MSIRSHSPVPSAGGSISIAAAAPVAPVDGFYDDAPAVVAANYPPGPAAHPPGNGAATAGGASLGVSFGVVATTTNNAAANANAAGQNNTPMGVAGENFLNYLTPAQPAMTVISAFTGQHPPPPLASVAPRLAVSTVGGPPGQTGSSNTIERTYARAADTMGFAQSRPAVSQGDSVSHGGDDDERGEENAEAVVAAAMARMPPPWASSLAPMMGRAPPPNGVLPHAASGVAMAAAAAQARARLPQLSVGGGTAPSKPLDDAVFAQPGAAAAAAAPAAAAPAAPAAPAHPTSPRGDAVPPPPSLEEKEEGTNEEGTARPTAGAGVGARAASRDDGNAEEQKTKRRRRENPNS